MTCYQAAAHALSDTSDIGDHIEPWWPNQTIEHKHLPSYIRDVICILIQQAYITVA